MKLAPPSARWPASWRAQSTWSDVLGFLGAIAAHIDANWVDAGTFLFAFAFAVFKHCKYEPKKRFLTKQTSKDFLDGTAVFPLAILALSIFSSDLTKALLEANKLILAIAGVVALLAILEE